MLTKPKPRPATSPTEPPAGGGWNGKGNRKAGNPYYLPPRRALRRTDPFGGWTARLPGGQPSRRTRLKRSFVSILPATLRLLMIVSVLSALIGAGLLLGEFAFEDAQAHVVAPTPTATPAPTRTPVPTPTPTPTITPSPTLRPPAIRIGHGLAYIWASKPVLSLVLRGPRPEGAGSGAEGGAEGQVGAFDNVFSCATCGDGKPDNREYFVCATGYEATLRGRTLSALERVPGREYPGVCVVGVWGATYRRMAIGFSADVAKALAVTPGKLPEIEIYTTNIPEGYVLRRPVGSAADDDERRSKRCQELARYDKAHCLEFLQNQ